MAIASLHSKKTMTKVAEGGEEQLLVGSLVPEFGNRKKLKYKMCL